MAGLGGPKASEVRLGLGVDRSITAAVVPTASQAGCCTQQDRQNNGYSGTPLWKIAQERAHKERENLLHPAVKLPEGFKPVDKVTSLHLPPGGRWYYSEKRQVFWNAEDAKMYVWDAASQAHLQLHEAKAYGLRIAAGSCFHERATHARHAVVRDLTKACQALRISTGHLDSPCALFAIYEGHRATPSAAAGQSACAEFCVKHLHQKLLPKLAAFQGYWEDSRLQSVVREAFEEVDAEFADKHAPATDGCCAAVALVLGQRVVLASLGDVACVVVTRDGEALELRGGVLRDPDEDEEDEEDGGAAGSAPASSGPCARWARSFGDLDRRGPGGTPRLPATPDVQVLHLEHRHQGIALVCRALYDAIGRSAAVSTVFRRSGGRPRMASGALVDAAVQWLGQVSDQSLGCIVVFFDGAEAADSPPAKKARTDHPSQVRLRHILLKHRECKSTVDKVRSRQVKRSRGEAERQLRAVLEECESDPQRRAFTQRCKDLSECVTSLSVGDLAGDLGWVKAGKLGKFGQAFDAAGLALQVGQLSDLVDSEQGIHIIMRVA